MFDTIRRIRDTAVGPAFNTSSVRANVPAYHSIVTNSHHLQYYYRALEDDER